jgi:hypothetical protein
MTDDRQKAREALAMLTKVIGYLETAGATGEIQGYLKTIGEALSPPPVDVGADIAYACIDRWIDMNLEEHDIDEYVLDRGNVHWLINKAIKDLSPRNLLQGQPQKDRAVRCVGAAIEQAPAPIEGQPQIDVDQIKADIIKEWSYTPIVGGHEIRPSSKTATKIGAVLSHLSRKGLLRTPIEGQPQIDVDATLNIIANRLYDMAYDEQAEFILHDKDIRERLTPPSTAIK